MKTLLDKGNFYYMAGLREKSEINTYIRILARFSGVTEQVARVNWWYTDPAIW